MGVAGTVKGGVDRLRMFGWGVWIITGEEQRGVSGDSSSARGKYMRTLVRI
ncbi:MAG: hypothetical protein SYNGOMJ08_00337 [Candidatus Syntrophoarchaeum sp. GoM_oil]|nr:MAG: hypothetical protein SYNGOMJ08_00337 [Candidatus Syntrophoarchaeum sp. GoM_oil]